MKFFEEDNNIEVRFPDDFTLAGSLLDDSYFLLGNLQSSGRGNHVMPVSQVKEAMTQGFMVKNIAAGVGIGLQYNSATKVYTITADQDSAHWGDIGGTITSQTDLWNMLVEGVGISFSKNTTTGKIKIDNTKPYTLTAQDIKDLTADSSTVVANISAGKITYTATGGGGGAVTKIIAGSKIAISPTSGTGDVTIAGSEIYWGDILGDRKDATAFFNSTDPLIVGTGSVTATCNSTTGTWIIAGGSGEVIHDSTLIGKGTTAEPLKADIHWGDLHGSILVNSTNTTKAEWHYYVNLEAEPHYMNEDISVHTSTDSGVTWNSQGRISIGAQDYISPSAGMIPSFRTYSSSDTLMRSLSAREMTNSDGTNVPSWGDFYSNHFEISGSTIRIKSTLFYTQSQIDTLFSAYHVKDVLSGSNVTVTEGTGTNVGKWTIAVDLSTYYTKTQADALFASETEVAGIQTGLNELISLLAEYDVKQILAGANITVTEGTGTNVGKWTIASDLSAYHVKDVLAGSNITVTEGTGANVGKWTFSASSDLLLEVAHDATLSGKGTAALPLAIVNPFTPSSYYTKTEVDSEIDMLEGYINQYKVKELVAGSNITVSESGNMKWTINADLSNYYNKTQTDALLADKANIIAPSGEMTFSSFTPAYDFYHSIEASRNNYELKSVSITANAAFPTPDNASYSNSDEAATFTFPFTVYNKDGGVETNITMKFISRGGPSGDWVKEMSLCSSTILYKKTNGTYSRIETGASVNEMLLFHWNTNDSGLYTPQGSEYPILIPVYIKKGADYKPLMAFKQTTASGVFEFDFQADSGFITVIENYEHQQYRGDETQAYTDSILTWGENALHFAFDSERMDLIDVHDKLYEHLAQKADIMHQSSSTTISIFSEMKMFIESEHDDACSTLKHMRLNVPTWPTTTKKKKRGVGDDTAPDAYILYITFLALDINRELEIRMEINKDEVGGDLTASFASSTHALYLHDWQGGSNYPLSLKTSGGNTWIFADPSIPFSITEFDILLVTRGSYAYIGSLTRDDNLITFHFGKEFVHSDSAFSDLSIQSIYDLGSGPNYTEVMSGCRNAIDYTVEHLSLTNLHQVHDIITSGLSKKGDWNDFPIDEWSMADLEETFNYYDPGFDPIEKEEVDRWNRSFLVNCRMYPMGVSDRMSSIYFNMSGAAQPLGWTSDKYEFITLKIGGAVLLMRIASEPNHIAIGFKESENFVEWNYSSEWVCSKQANYDVTIGGVHIYWWWGAKLICFSDVTSTDSHTPSPVYIINYQTTSPGQPNYNFSQGGVGSKLSFLLGPDRNIRLQDRIGELLMGHPGDGNKASGTTVVGGEFISSDSMYYTISDYSPRATFARFFQNSSGDCNGFKFAIGEYGAEPLTVWYKNPISPTQSLSKQIPVGTPQNTGDLLSLGDFAPNYLKLYGNPAKLITEGVCNLQGSPADIGDGDVYKGVQFSQTFGDNPTLINLSGNHLLLDSAAPVTDHKTIADAIGELSGSIQWGDNERYTTGGSSSRTGILAINAERDQASSDGFYTHEFKEVRTDGSAPNKVGMQFRDYHTGNFANGTGPDSIAQKFEAWSHDEIFKFYYEDANSDGTHKINSADILTISGLNIDFQSPKGELSVGSGNDISYLNKASRMLPTSLVSLGNLYDGHFSKSGDYIRIAEDFTEEKANKIIQATILNGGQFTLTDTDQRVYIGVAFEMWKDKLMDLKDLLGSTNRDLFYINVNQDAAYPDLQMVFTVAWRPSQNRLWLKIEHDGSPFTTPNTFPLAIYDSVDNEFSWVDPFDLDVDAYMLAETGFVTQIYSTMEWRDGCFILQQYEHEGTGFYTYDVKSLYAGATEQVNNSISFYKRLTIDASHKLVINETVEDLVDVHQDIYNLRPSQYVIEHRDDATNNLDFRFKLIVNDMFGIKMCFLRIDLSYLHTLNNYYIIDPDILNAFPNGLSDEFLDNALQWKLKDEKTSGILTIDRGAPSSSSNNILILNSSVSNTSTFFLNWTT